MAQRNTATRDRHRSAIARTKPPCALCEQPIDYTLKYPDPGAYVVDHITPLSRGGPDTLDNKQAAHRDCNRTKSAALPTELTAANTPRTYITARTWGGTPTRTRPLLTAQAGTPHSFFPNGGS